MPSLPFLSSASLLEVLWVISCVCSAWLAFKGWLHAAKARVRLKNGIRAALATLLGGVGLLAMFTPARSDPNLLTVLTPLAATIVGAGMGLLSVIDEQDQASVDTHVIEFLNPSE